MAFRHHRLGALVASEPATAHAELVELFRLHRTREEVAKEAGVDGRTLARWIDRFVKLALGDPRDAAEVPRRGRPRAA